MRRGISAADSRVFALGCRLRRPSPGYERRRLLQIQLAITAAQMTAVALAAMTSRWVTRSNTWIRTMTARITTPSRTVGRDLLAFIASDSPSTARSRNTGRLGRGLLCRRLELLVHDPDALAQVLYELQQDLWVLVDERLQSVPSQHSNGGCVARLRTGRTRLVVEHGHLAQNRARSEPSQRDLPAFVVEVDADLAFEHHEKLGSNVALDEDRLALSVVAGGPQTGDASHALPRPRARRRDPPQRDQLFHAVAESIRRGAGGFVDPFVRLVAKRLHLRTREGARRARLECVRVEELRQWTGQPSGAEV